MQRSKGMMSRVPSPALLVPLEHGEISHPKKTEVLRGITGFRKRSVFGRVFLSEIKPELAASLEELVYTLLRICLAHHHQPQIAGLDFSRLQKSFQRIGIILGKAIGIGHQAHRCRPLGVCEDSVSSNGSPFGPGHLPGFRNSNEYRSDIRANLERRGKLLQFFRRECLPYI